MMEDLDKLIDFSNLNDLYKRQKIREIMESYGIIGTSDAILKAFISAYKIAKSDSTVLIYGESGVGKELFANVIHKISKRADGPFVKINCAAIPETLLESELFGYEKGAFTGAVKSKPGKFELANKGTIFLDEIGEIPLSIQTKLLRVIEEKVITRVGGIKPIEVDVRIIAATNKDLWLEVVNGNFRDDLFYRISVVSIKIPPLRERVEDIPLLVKHFIEKFSKREGKVIKAVEPEFSNFLLHYPFMGNVRELSNFIERAVVLTDDGVLKLEHLHEYAVNFLSSTLGRNVGPIKPLEVSEKEEIMRALRLTQGNLTKAAQLLGVHRNTLYLKLKKYNINRKLLKKLSS